MSKATDIVITNETDKTVYFSIKMLRMKKYDSKQTMDNNMISDSVDPGETINLTENLYPVTSCAVLTAQLKTNREPTVTKYLSNLNDNNIEIVFVYNLLKNNFDGDKIVVNMRRSREGEDDDVPEEDEDYDDDHDYRDRRRERKIDKARLGFWEGMSSGYNSNKNMSGAMAIGVSILTWIFFFAFVIILVVIITAVVSCTWKRMDK